jgi:hypothetical protein
MVEISPEVQAELARQAASRGSAIEEYAAALLERSVHRPETPGDTETHGRERKNGLVEVCAMVSGLTDDLDFSRSPSTDRPVDL